MKKEEYGSLGTYHKRPIKIAEWSFRSPWHTGPADSYVAKIMLCSKWELNGPHKLYFEASSKHFDERIKDSDIDSLQRKVKREFEKQDMKARLVVWEDWIEVEIDHGLYMWNNEFGDGLTIKYAILKRGVHPDTSEAFTINSNGVVVAFPKDKLADVEDHKPDDEKWHLGLRDKNKQFSYIPATKENIAALESLCARLKELRFRLASLLTQDTVQKSLNGGFGNLLPYKKAQHD